MADGGVHAHVGARDPVRDGVVHGLARDHFAAFVERVQEGGRSLLRYVVAEFEAFVRCGCRRVGSWRRFRWVQPARGGARRGGWSRCAGAAVQVHGAACGGDGAGERAARRQPGVPGEVTAERRATHRV